MDNYKFDIKTKKEGWKSMKKMLDSEMPVKKNKRVFIWLPLLFLIGISLVSFTWIFVNKTGHTSNKPVKKEIIKENNPSKSINNLQAVNLPLSNRENEIKTTDARPTGSKTGNRLNSSIKKINKKNISKQKNVPKENIKTKTQLSEPIANKTTILKRKNIDIKSISSPNNYLRSEKTSSFFIPPFPNEIVYHKHAKIDFFNPFIETKAHIYNYKKWSPKMEFEIGNLFFINSKFSVGINLGIVQSETVYQQISKSSTDILGGDFSSNNTESLYDTTYANSSKWLMEISLLERYQINKNIGLGLSGGLVLENLKITGFNKKYDYSSTNNSAASNSPNNFITGFLDANLFYVFKKHVYIKAGYKYYMTGSKTINERNVEIYSQKLVKNPYSTRLYIGIGYNW